MNNSTKAWPTKAQTQKHPIKTSSQGGFLSFQLSFAHNQCAWLWKFTYKKASSDTKGDFCASSYVHV